MPDNRLRLQSKVIVLVKKMIQNYAKDIKERPSDMLAIGRTAMANERTLLSFISTSVGLLASSVGLIKFVEGPFFLILGWMLVPISLAFLIWGVIRYFRVKRLLQESHSLMKSAMDDDE